MAPRRRVPVAVRQIGQDAKEEGYECHVAAGEAVAGGCRQHVKVRGKLGPWPVHRPLQHLHQSACRQQHRHHHPCQPGAADVDEPARDHQPQREPEDSVSQGCYRIYQRLGGRR